MAPTTWPSTSRRGSAAAVAESASPGSIWTPPRRQPSASSASAGSPGPGSEVITSASTIPVERQKICPVCRIIKQMELEFSMDPGWLTAASRTSAVVVQPARLPERRASDSSRVVFCRR